MLATRLGVSLENVVATIERPASHQGTERPDAKNSVVLLPDRFPKNSAGTKQMAMAQNAMIQSIVERCMLDECSVSGGRYERRLPDIPQVPPSPQPHDAAAESRARQPRPERAGAHRALHQFVQLRNAH